jgi:integrase
MSITLGLRRAELIGLTWDCINSIETKNGASVFIKQQLMTVHGKTQIVPKTKSKKPRRIELTEEIRLLLLAEKRRTGGGPKDAIFTREDGSLMNEQEYSRRWKAAFASYSSREEDYFRPHYNRHITASLLHRAGYSMDQTSEMLGHQNSTITRDVYTHLTRGQARSAVVDVEKLING